MSRRIENVVVLGATGSIGASTLDVIARHPDRYRAFAVTAHSRAEELVEICRRMAPSYAVIGERMAYTTLRERIGRVAPNTVVLQGADALASVAAAPEADTVMAAIVGAAGLSPTLAAAAAGKRVLLANKEALVMAGPVFMAAVRSSGARLLPIDSEHNAIFQCLPPARSNTPRIDAGAGVRRILLTGSGGPFRTTPLAELAAVTRSVVTKAGYTLDDVDWFVAHQANDRINEAVRKNLGIPAEKVPSNIARYGNTSAATIGILLDELRRDGKVKEGQLVCMLALGSGLHWGATLVRM